jgi:8-oxo-dGTP pyrophosphatase MutT (NUDIX family)
MPDKAAAREAFEEAGVDSDPQNFSFVGQFSMLEPSFLYLTVCWSLPYGDFVMQPDEVSEIVRVPYTEVRNLETRQKWVGEFYPAQWTMFGWLMCHIYYDKRPVFHPWRDEDSDGWAKFDSRS